MLMHKPHIQILIITFTDLFSGLGLGQINVDLPFFGKFAMFLDSINMLLKQISYKTLYQTAPLIRLF